MVENDGINVTHINNLFLSLSHHYHSFFTGGFGIDLVGHFMTKSSGYLITCISGIKCNNFDYYSTIAPFYHIWSRERAKYETVIHCSVPV